MEEWIPNTSKMESKVESHFGSWDMGVLRCFGTLKQRFDPPNLVQIVKTFKIIQDYINKMGSHIQIKYLKQKLSPFERLKA